MMQQQLEAEASIRERIQQEALAVAQIQEATRSYIESVNEQAAELTAFVKKLNEQNRQISEQIMQWVKSQPERDREEQQARERLAQFGWFPDPKMPWNAPIVLMQEIDSNSSKEDVVDTISQYFRKRIDDIEVEVEENFPTRRCILIDAFQAHREAKYNLSVPVFLTQADGIWCDTFKKSLFSRQDRESVLYSFNSDTKDKFFSLMLDVFKLTIPMWASQTQRDLSLDALNRHQVLHGEIVDYGTEQNSLQAISFLSWLNWILKDVDKAGA